MNNVEIKIIKEPYKQDSYTLEIGEYTKLEKLSLQKLCNQIRFSLCHCFNKLYLNDFTYELIELTEKYNLGSKYDLSNEQVATYLSECLNTLYTVSHTNKNVHEIDEDLLKEFISNAE